MQSFSYSNQINTMSRTKEYDLFIKLKRSIISFSKFSTLTAEILQLEKKQGFALINNKCLYKMLCKLYDFNVSYHNFLTDIDVWWSICFNVDSILKTHRNHFIKSFKLEAGIIGLRLKRKKSHLESIIEKHNNYDEIIGLDPGLRIQLCCVRYRKNDFNKPFEFIKVTKLTEKNLHKIIDMILGTAKNPLLIIGSHRPTENHSKFYHAIRKYCDVLEVDEFRTSKACSKCNSNKFVTLTANRHVICSDCKSTIDRDINAASNICKIGWFHHIKHEPLRPIFINSKNKKSSNVFID